MNKNVRIGGRANVGDTAIQHFDSYRLHRGLPRTRDERPCYCASGCNGDELASPHKSPNATVRI